MPQRKYLIFDYGASHGRCLAAIFDGKTFQMELVHEFDNRPVQYAGSLYWDILRLASELDIGLVKAFRQHPDIASVGIDTWGCDFGFIDGKGKLLANPFNYRDEWRHRYKHELDGMIGEYEIFKLGGANTNPIMGLYHLYALGREKATELNYAKKFLMIPDLLNYYLTGEAANEYTNATMSLMVDQQNRTWQYELTDRIGANRELFCQMRKPGTVLGSIRKSKCEELGIPQVPVVTVATHDTASAIAGVPLEDPNREWAFVSMGTWAIFGQETDSISTDRKTFESGFANQGGVEGKNNFVNLLTGLWIIQQCRQHWNLRQGREIHWNEVVAAAKEARAGAAYIDVQDPAFSLPDANMPGVIRNYCSKRGHDVPEDMGAVARVVFESMVMKFQQCMEDIRDIKGKTPELVHVFGGGVQNKLLCQWMADAMQTTIKAGPTETTSVGNLLMQMMAMGDIGSINEGRKIAARSSAVLTYEPAAERNWAEDFILYKRAIQSNKG